MVVADEVEGFGGEEGADCQDVFLILHRVGLTNSNKDFCYRCAYESKVHVNIFN